MNTTILSVGIKYSMHYPISDVDLCVSPTTLHYGS